MPPLLSAVPRNSLRRILLGVLAAAVLVVAVLPSTASADTASDIPLPGDGDYLGSVTEDEADPGEYASQAGSVGAASLSGFSAGNIISDAKMYTSGTMSAAAIQSFLNGKVPSCNAAYTCLKNFTQNTVTKQANTYCSGTYQGASHESAATIISKAAVACGVSEKVLLVMLQKEQGLVTHTWPSSWRYDMAMGYACPDTSGCDAKYLGFQNQVYMAAYQLQRYTKDSYFNWYPVGKASQVRWSPNTSCGSGAVTIANNATAALYYYTPYQPNAASLAAGYGSSSDPCASYGNRNFYNYYTDWFGSTQGSSSPDASGTVAVQRFWSKTFDNAHFYTVNDAEAQKLRQSDPNWIYEGTDFRVWPVSGNACRSGSVAVYRFWSSTFESHFYTTNAAEANTVRTKDKNWAYEGIAFCTATAGQKGAKPVYRFWSSEYNKHFYTANESEMKQLRDKDPNWTYEGVAMYAPA